MGVKNKKLIAVLRWPTFKTIKRKKRGLAPNALQ